MRLPALRRLLMDPLWVLVILVGFASLVVAVSFIVIAVKVSHMAREVGPKVAQMQEQLKSAGQEIQQMAVAVESVEGRFNTLADKAASATGRVAKVVAVVPRVMTGVRDAEIRAEGAVRGVAVVALRSLKRRNPPTGH
jgi:uncharacterized protein YoxC